MAENYVDLFSTTVSNSGSGYTAGSGTLNVASTTGLTASCTVVIMTQALPSTVKALLHVTSVTSGTVLAVTSEGTDNNAVDGDFVYAVLSKRAIDAIKTDILASVPPSVIFANQPATFTNFITNQASAGGNETKGVNIIVTASGQQIKGFKVAWASAGGAKTVKITLWDRGTNNAGTTNLGTATGSVNATGLYEIDFGSPISVTSGHFYMLACWDNSGATYSKASNLGFRKAPPYQFGNGPCVILTDVFWGSGDVEPTSAATTEAYPIIEPVFV